MRQLGQHVSKNGDCLLSRFAAGFNAVPAAAQIPGRKIVNKFYYGPSGADRIVAVQIFSGVELQLLQTLQNPLVKNGTISW